MQLHCTNENTTRIIDDFGRLVIPKSLRNRFGIQEGDELEFYTLDGEGHRFIGVKKARDTFNDPRYEVALAVLEEFGCEPPVELLNKMKERDI